MIAPRHTRAARLLQRLRGVWDRERRLRSAVALVMVAVAGGVLGLAVLGRTAADVGPVHTTMSLAPSLTGEAKVNIPPLGALGFDTYDAPIGVRIDVDSLDVPAVKALVTDPKALDALPDVATRGVRRGLLLLAVRSLLVAVLGAFVFGLVTTRRLRRSLAAAATAAGLLVADIGLAAATFDPASVTQPRFSGLLASAPSVIGDAGQISRNFTVYKHQLAQLVTNVSKLYDVGLTLPTYAPNGSTIRVLHVSDIHSNPAAWPVIASLVQEFKIDVIVDTGDLTDHGASFEDQVATNIGALKVPYVWIRGNHDSAETQRAVEREPNAVVLDNTVAEVDGLTFAGIGDPRFTPDKDTRGSAPATSVTAAGQKLTATLAGRAGTVDVALVHDPTMATELDGLVPLVLAGHIHRRLDYLLPKTTVVYVEGSTGAAGLRGLEGEKPTPVEASVLYFDRATRRVQARDDITLGGLGLESATLERHLADEKLPSEPPAPSGTPGPSTGTFDPANPSTIVPSTPLSPVPGSVATAPRASP